MTATGSIVASSGHPENPISRYHFRCDGKPSDHDASRRGATIVAATGDSTPRGAEERADFIRAVSDGLNDVEAGREISLVGAAILLGLNLDGAPP